MSLTGKSHIVACKFKKKCLVVISQGTNENKCVSKMPKVF